MMEGSTLLLNEPLNPKHYLDQILNQYPYDIDPSLVYTLLTKHPAPHPALFTFIDFIRRSEKMLVTKKAHVQHNLHPLYEKMAAFTHHSQALTHIHSFCFDALLNGSPCPTHPIYPYLTYEKITQIDHVHILQNAPIYLPAKGTPPPIAFSAVMPLAKLSLDPKQYFALSLTVHDVHGLLLMPHHAAALIPALAVLYPFTAEPVHHNFLLLYGIQMPERKNIIAYDANENQYIGCSYHSDPGMVSFHECLTMIRSLYAAITLHQHDLTLTAAMLDIALPNQHVSLLLCDPNESRNSALYDALELIGKQRDLTITKQFVNYGTIHLLDDSLYATGTQIGAAARITPLTAQLSFDHSGEDIYLNEANDRAYRLTPLSFSAPKHRFQPIHIIALPGKGKTIQRFTRPEEVLPHLSSCGCIPASFPHREEKLNDALINTALLNDIPLIALPNHKDPCQKAKALFNWIQSQFTVPE